MQGSDGERAGDRERDGCGLKLTADDGERTEREGELNNAMIGRWMA